MRRADLAAFERIYDDTFAGIYRFCARRLLSDPDSVPDAVADIYATAWRRVDQLLGADDPVRWLYGVARRTLANRYRAQARRGRLDGRLRRTRLAAVPDPGDTIGRRDDVTALRDALTTLDPVDREIVIMASWDQLAHTEIAAVTGLSVDAVRSRLFRARRTLKAHIGEPARDEGAAADTHTANQRDGRGPDDGGT